MTKIDYFAGNKTAGYSGYVLYWYQTVPVSVSCNVSFWMVPGTWEFDWDNQ